MEVIVVMLYTYNNNIFLNRTRLVDEAERPVIEVFNQTPFVFKDRNFSCLNGERVFEIYNSDNSEKG